MRAIVIEQACGAAALIPREVPTPSAKCGWALVKIRAFGINRAEIYTRNGLSPDVHFPRIIGIECVGEIVDPSDSGLVKGQTVVSMMKGMGREFDGSYAEFCLIPNDQIYPIERHWDWATFAAIPETYYTAYGSLFERLQLKANETLLIRGGSSACGLAALQLAKATGTTVISTTRNPQNISALYRQGADQVLLDNGNLAAELQVDKVLELVGAASLKDSLKCLKPKGIACFTGILSGWIIPDFYPIDDIPNGSYLTSFHSDSVNADTIAAMFNFIHQQQITIQKPTIFPLEHIAQAHQLMENDQSVGKVVVLNT